MKNVFRSSIYLALVVPAFFSVSCKPKTDVASATKDEGVSASPTNVLSLQDVVAACKTPRNVTSSTAPREITEDEVNKAIDSGDAKALSDIKQNLPRFNEFEEITQELEAIAEKAPAVAFDSAKLDAYYKEVQKNYQEHYREANRGKSDVGPLPDSQFEKLIRSYVSKLPDELAVVKHEMVGGAKAGHNETSYGDHLLGNWLTAYMKGSPVASVMTADFDRLESPKVSLHDYDTVALFIAAYYPKALGLTDQQISNRAGRILENKVSPSLVCNRASSIYLGQSQPTWEQLGMNEGVYSPIFNRATLYLGRLRYEKYAVATWVPLTGALFNAADNFLTFAEGKTADGKPLTAWQRSGAFAAFSFDYFMAVSDVYMVKAIGKFAVTKGPVVAKNLVTFTKALRGKIAGLPRTVEGATQAGKLIRTVETAGTEAKATAEAVNAEKSAVAPVLDSSVSKTYRELTPDTIRNYGSDLTINAAYLQDTGWKYIATSGGKIPEESMNLFQIGNKIKVEMSPRGVGNPLYINGEIVQSTGDSLVVTFKWVEQQTLTHVQTMKISVQNVRRIFVFPK